MCVIFFAYKRHPKFPLILLANRDEFYNRPTEAAHFWKDFPHILAGRDKIGGGTWLGVTRQGRFAAVTNYRDSSAPKGKFSRGNLVADFLKSNDSAESYLRGTQNKAAEFSGFNLLVGEINAQRNEMFYFSNRTGEVKKLEAGLYGLSNHLLDTPWRKVGRGKANLAQMLAQNEFSKESFFQLLADKTLADDADLPETGIGYEREKLLSAIYIETPVYGTRCSSVLTFDANFTPDFEERVFV